MRPEVLGEYERWKEQLPEEDPYVDQTSLGIVDVLRAHFCLVDYFFDVGEGVGGVGPKSLDLLHSALYRQHISFEGKRKWQDRFDIVATLFYGIIMNHPFHDANKRTAFISCIYHLEKIRKCLIVSHKEFEDLTVLIADRQLNKFDRYKELVKKKEKDPEVRFISWYLRNNSREIDKRFYAVTYRKLKTILATFGFDMQNERHNHIDIIRVKEKRRIFGIFGPKEKLNVKVCQIGFPGWTSQVGQGAIKTVQRECGLDYENGVDSQTFFQGQDPIDCLIAKYHEPIRNLAER